MIAEAPWVPPYNASTSAMTSPHPFFSPEVLTTPASWSPISLAASRGRTPNSAWMLCVTVSGVANRP